PISNLQSPTSNLQPPISNNPSLLRKIEPDLLKAALEDRATAQRFLVHVRSPDPDLSALQSLPAPARRRAIIEQLQETATATQQGIRAYLAKAQAEGHVAEYKPFWIFNGLVVTGDASTLMELASRSDVKMIRADRKYWLPEPDRIPGTYTATPVDTVKWGVERVRAPMAWQALGIDGTGVVVASMDTGVDWQHPDLLPAYRGYNDKGLPIHTGNWYSVTDEEYFYPGDGNGHGTHTTATMVGQNGVGVAPGARWIAVKLFHNQGHTFESWIHDAFQWILAPAGNPDLAPDVVNGSWSNAIPEDEALRGDIRLLRAAGIVPVFAIGNYGPERESLGSPASYPESLAVGAVDQDDEIASFSARGPSPWGEVKPEVVAPGTGVRSAVPGGGQQAWNGTSMATPHVSGVVALLLQADPSLIPSKVEEILEATATPLGETAPNNDAGWGLVDAYRAVASVMDVGFLHGRVTRSIDGQPVAGAQVTVAYRDGEDFAHTTTDAEGEYTLTLPPGPYELHITAFAYKSADAHGVRVSKDSHTSRDISLALRPAGVLFGQVTDDTTGGPISATISVAGTPVSVQTGDAIPGQYSLSLPAGDYELQVVSQGHRVGHASVSITVDQGIKQDFELPAAPTILLVDSGAWYYGSQRRFFTEGLDSLDYSFDTWRIKDVETDLPTAKDLSAYDILIWSSPRDAPGLIGASDAITNYLEAGGRLLLSGQDVGYWDGGGSQDFSASYYPDYLRAIYVKDDAGYREVYGAANTGFEGLQTGLGRADSARNQRFPDEIAVLDEEYAQPAFFYGDPETTPGRTPAGLIVGQCLPYRAIYLAFGIEGVDTAPDRADLLARAIQVLTAPSPQFGITLTTDTPSSSGSSDSRLIATPGSIARHVARMRNTGQETELFDVSLRRGVWETTLWSGDFSQPLAETVRIESCEAITVGVEVTIPMGLPRHTADNVTLRAASHPKSVGESVSDEIVMTTKTPAGILLVDDDRWINVEESYRRPLESLGVGYDDWKIGWTAGEALGSPSDDTLALYPVVIWFTGYDWYQTLTPGQESSLGRFLGNGGRLFFSSQDYMYTAGFRSFAPEYLGVLTYTEDMTSTVITGETDNSIGEGLGPFDLDYPFQNHSDVIEPVEGASVVFRGNRHRPVAVSYAPKDVGFKSVFFAFPFETLSRSAAETVLSRVLDWLSPLQASSLSLDRATAAEGDEVTATVRLLNDGLSTANAQVRAFMPAEADYVAGSLPNAEYDPGSRSVEWATNVPAGNAVDVSYRLRLAPVIPDNTTIRLNVEIMDEVGLTLHRVAAIRVDAPDLSASQKSVSQAQAEMGDVLTYTLTLRNRGTSDGQQAALYDELPAQLELMTGSLSATSGRATSDGRRVVWEGQVLRDNPVTISYRARVVGHGTITNLAWVSDGTGITTEHSATTVVPTRLYLPLVTLRGND
ncbi:MAG: S8 family serine peptidase, partial [Anaerolineae bacterium]